MVVQGDTNSGLAGALAANAVEIPIVHLEAGLRSFDRGMPEEHNRVLIDALAERCCAPHESNAELLEREGISAERIRITGSTLSEALVGMLPSPDERRRLLADHGVDASAFVLATIHRAENADDAAKLEVFLDELAHLDVPVVLPLHPRTRARAAEFGLQHLLDRLIVVAPLGYREFIGLAAESAVLVSDSGGVQEEATILKRPVVVVRASTERPEIVGTFARLVDVGPQIGAEVRAVTADVVASHAALESLPYPYGSEATALCVAAIDELAGA